MQENNYTSHNYHDEEASLDLKKILNVVWGMRWIILASVLLCLLLAWCYNKVTKTRYTANAKIMLVNMKGRSDLINLSDLISGFENSYIANETEILNSRTLMQRVVEEFGLNYTYEKKRPIKSIIYYGNNPFRVLVDSTENFSEPPQMQLFFSPTDSSSFQRLRFRNALHALRGTVTVA